jgi:hypothetical protein
VSDIERGKRNVTVPELIGLVVVLGATVDQLLDPRGPERKVGPAVALTADVDYLFDAETFRHLLVEDAAVYVESVWTFDDDAKRVPRKVQIEFTDKAVDE